MRQIVVMGWLPDYTDLSTAVSSPTADVNAAVDAGGDLARRAGETQALAITRAGENMASGLKTTAAQIEGDITKKLVVVAVLGGGLYALAKYKGWI